MKVTRLASALVAGALAVGVTTTAASSATTDSGTQRRAHASTVRGDARVTPAAAGQVRALVGRALDRVRTLQATTAGEACIGGVKVSDTPAAQSCTFTGSGACLQMSTVANATQRCVFTQTAGRTNVAIVVQVIVQRDGAASSSQTGSQDAEVQQQNTTRPNLSYVVQIVKQSLGRGADVNDTEIADQARIESSAESSSVLPDFTPLIGKLESGEPSQEGSDPATAAAFGPAADQTQQVQQTSNVCQGGPGDTLAGTCKAPLGMVAANLSSIYQSLRQREKAANAASIAQHQNPAAGSCPRAGVDGRTTNMCAVVDQSTTGGKNQAALVELYRQFQSALNSHATTQEQDPSPFHGLDHDIHQLSAGPTTGAQRNTIRTDQRGRQVQRIANGGAVHQLQDPVGRKGLGSFQTGSAADTWNGTLIGSQAQLLDGVFSTAGVQDEELSYDGDSTGTIAATVTATQDGSSQTSQCGGGMTCHTFVECTSGCTASGPQHTVFGDGHVGGDQPFTFHVTADAGANGQGPTGVVVFQDGTNVFHGDVGAGGCLLVNGNTALVVGRMPDSEVVPAESGRTFPWVTLWVEDNGPPAAGQPVDRAFGLYSSDMTKAGVCMGLLPPSFQWQPLDAGDVTVNGGGSVG